MRVNDDGDSQRRPAVLSSAGRDPMSEERRVSDVMTTRVATVGPDVKLETIASAFARHPFHHIPVVGPDGRVVGIVSDRDLMRACIDGRFEKTKPCSAIMTQIIASIPGDATVREAAQRLVKLGVNSLLIIEDGKLKGILTSRDIVKATAEA
jgi:CBS domain-containing protein